MKIFSRYPRTLTNDCQQLQKAEVDVVFTPNDQAIYPSGQEAHSTIHAGEWMTMHCGASRPCFFVGIATIANKLFNIVTPDIAILGEKDFQQLCIIKKMVLDFMLPIEIIGSPTVRESNGPCLKLT